MNRIVLAAALAALLSTPVLAQHQHHGDAKAPKAAESALPEACRTPAAAPAMGGHDMGSHAKLNDHQRAAMAGMMQMDRDMAAGMMQEDADMAFMCGMIAHHQGAVAMAEVVLEYGDDEEAKALARRIIDAQKPEIEEMTAWVARQTGK